MAGWIVAVVIAVIAMRFYIRQKRSHTSAARNNIQQWGVVRNQMVSNISRTVPNLAQTETGSMVYFANDRHGHADKEYRFNYRKVGGEWRAYILKMPSLGNRDSSCAVTHRLHDNGGYYVCWDSPVHSLKDMQTISRVWADNIQEYIATGKRFG